MKLAIVGGGISASSLLKKLRESTLSNLEIDIFEKNHKLGAGFPYSDDASTAIMNEHAIDLSIYSENPQDFYNWLADNNPEWADPDAFVPRQIYGNYLHDRMLPYYQKEGITVIQEEVVDMEFDQHIHDLQTADGAWHRNYEAVFFAIGHPPYADHYSLLGQNNYIHNPYPIQNKLHDFNDSHTIGIIGSGLTALDVINYLLGQEDFPGKIQVFSPSEPFKTVKFKRYKGELTISFSSAWLANQLAINVGRIPLDIIVDQFMADLKANAIDISTLYQTYGTGSLQEVRKAIDEEPEELLKLRLYIVKMTAFLPDLYNALSPSDRDNYHRQYEEIFNHFRSQMPASSLAAVVEWQDQGRLEFISGIKEVESDENGFKVKTDREIFQRDVLINAAGFEFDLRQAQDLSPLVKNLYNKEIFTPHYRKGIMVSWPSCQVVTANLGILPQVYLLGHWISGIHYGNNNIHLCIKQAELVAQHFIDKHS